MSSSISRFVMDTDKSFWMGAPGRNHKIWGSIVTLVFIQGALGMKKFETTWNLPPCSWMVATTSLILVPVLCRCWALMSYSCAPLICQWSCLPQYLQALNTEQWKDGEPAEAEKDFWEIAAMEAYSHLTEWKSLQYCSTVYIDENSPPNLERMWAEPFHQVPDLNCNVLGSSVKLQRVGIVHNQVFKLFKYHAIIC